jgi:hypothetical protein
MFGCIILKDGYEILIGVPFDGVYIVHPYAYDRKTKKLIDVTTLCPKLKLYWKETPAGYDM